MNFSQCVSLNLLEKEDMSSTDNLITIPANTKDIGSYNEPIKFLDHDRPLDTFETLIFHRQTVLHRFETFFFLGCRKKQTSNDNSR